MEFDMEISVALSPNVDRRTGTMNRPEVKYFYGSSQGSKNAHVYGRVQALPPQRNIPGFHRIEMMKYFQNRASPNDLSIWCYERCVLPGGHIMVGRWWTSSLLGDLQPFEVGPFIYWNVGRSTAVPPIKGRDALDFLADITGQ